MQETIVVRDARIADLPEIAEHWLAMFEEVGKHQEAEFDPHWRQRFVDYFSERIRSGDAAYFVAIDNDRVIGTAGALLTDGYPAAIHGIRNGYIFGVHVDPPYRGQGLATRLTELTIAFLQTRKPWAIRLHASPFGRRIYEKLGFTPTNEMQLQ
jgi:ribosomal protein S18 acetylase RimI-like enzyme